MPPISRRRVVCAALILMVSLLTGCAAKRPENLGVTDGQFAPCPSPPRCVSSQAPIPDVNHNIASYELIVTSYEGWEALLEIVETMPRTAIVVSEPDYLHAEVRTTVGFVDDLEFYLDDFTNTIQVRSSARTGYWDLSTNRKRVDDIRSRLRTAGVVR